MSRSVPLGPVTQGINRLRTKGGANPEGLYDFVNGYLTSAGVPVSRPGTRRMATLPSNTKGLCAFQGELHTFSTVVQELDAPYVNHVLVHPDDSSQELAEIHFAAPFMGFLYVAAEFENGDIYHYWLQVVGTWTADTVYRPGAIVEPTEENGLAYRANRIGDPNPVWSAGTRRIDGDQVEPTEANGYYYVVTATLGDAPASGSTEPTWPTEEGATITESQLAEDTAVQAAIDSGLSVYIDPTIADRYDR